MTNKLYIGAMAFDIVVEPELGSQLLREDRLTLVEIRDMVIKITDAIPAWNHLPFMWGIALVAWDGLSGMDLSSDDLARIGHAVAMVITENTFVCEETATHSYCLGPTPKIKIGAMEYQIVCDNKTSNDHDFYGQHDFKRGVITMDNDLAIPKFWHTLWHEIIHGICCHCRIKDVEGYRKDLSFVGELALAIPTLIYQNPELLAVPHENA